MFDEGFAKLRFPGCGDLGSIVAILTVYAGALGQGRSSLT